MRTKEQIEATRRIVVETLRKNYVRIPGALLLDVGARKLGASAFATYCYLLFRQGANNNTFIGVEEIKWGTGYSKSQVDRNLAELETAGHIRRQRRWNTSSRTYCTTYVAGNGSVMIKGVPAEEARSFEYPVAPIKPQKEKRIVEVGDETKEDAECDALLEEFVNGPKTLPLSREFNIENAEGLWNVVRSTASGGERFYKLRNLRSHRVVEFSDGAELFDAWEHPTVEQRNRREDEIALRYLESDREPVPAHAFSEENEEEDIPLF